MNLKHYLLHLVMRHGRNKAKKKGPLLGQRFAVPRPAEKDVETILYRPQKAGSAPIPSLFNVHGAAFSGQRPVGNAEGSGSGGAYHLRRGRAAGPVRPSMRSV